jgi:hypothetical protein
MRQDEGNYEYEGEWEGGNMNGNGKLVIIGKYIYTGNFKDNRVRTPLIFLVLKIAFIVYI